MTQERPDQPAPRTDADASIPLHACPRPSRREIVRHGVKLAFVAPVITTFLASEAQAAGSNFSCYAAGHACDLPGQQEDCCSGICVGNVCT